MNKLEYLLSMLILLGIEGMLLAIMIPVTTLAMMMILDVGSILIIATLLWIYYKKSLVKRF